MERTWVHIGTLGLGLLAFACWLVMFLAGHDVWHDLGRPDVWTLQGPSYTDLRAFAYAFYLLPLVLLVQLAFSTASLWRTNRA